MTGQEHPAVFGYGSLVNRATHSFAPAAPARLGGWRRLWCATGTRPFAYLSVEPADAEIDGLIAAVPGDDWSALDLREAAYRRHVLGHERLSLSPSWAAPPQIYAVPDPQPARNAAILLSYLDVVVQGFLREFGPSGALRFFATTTGWQSGIHDDRAAPLYPRAQPHSDDERRLTDRLIQEHGVPRRAT